VVIVGLLMFVGVPVQSLPIARYFVAPVDNAAVLSTLAIAVRRQQPIADNLMLLSELAQSSRSRNQLGVAVGRIEDGMHWTDALQYSGLISKAENGVIRSAERAGNLAWALEEMADSTLRRTAQRAQAALNVLFPCCLVTFGFCVLFVAVGMMMPLFSLIGSLA
jgi:type II secretory pathway component PulF